MFILFYVKIPLTPILPLFPYTTLFRSPLEEIAGRPVDELDEERVRQRGSHVHRQLVDDVGRERNLVRGGQCADTQRLRESVGAADVGHQVARGAALDQLAELEASVVVLAGGDGNA